MKFFAKHWARIAVTLLPLLFALGHATHVLNISLVQTLDNTIYDARLRAYMPRTLDPRIVIVDIDEKSLSEIGQWPWSRNKLAALTNELFQNHNIALLGFDLVFAEADGSSGLQQFKRLAENELSTDQPFLAQYKIRPLMSSHQYAYSLPAFFCYTYGFCFPLIHYQGQLSSRFYAVRPRFSHIRP